MPCWSARSIRSVWVLKRPGDLGVDIAVAEGQSLGNPLQYGGPYLGIMACRDKFVRRLPGRIAGQTVDRRGRRCWVLTLQTREQHIRRDKATSNICTNQGLFALRAAIYLSFMGPHGMRDVGRTLCAQSALCGTVHHSRRSVRTQVSLSRCSRNSWSATSQGQVAELLQQALEAGILAGVPLGRWYPELDDCLLVTVTEKRTAAEIERLAQCLQPKRGRHVSQQVISSALSHVNVALRHRHPTTN